MEQCSTTVPEEVLPSETTPPQWTGGLPLCHVVWVLCSDWLVCVTWCVYCALIGWFVSRGVNIVL